MEAALEGRQRRHEEAGSLLRLFLCSDFNRLQRKLFCKHTRRLQCFHISKCAAWYAFHDAYGNIV